MQEQTRPEGNKTYLLLSPAALDCFSDTFTTFRYFILILLYWCMIGPWQLSWKAPAVVAIELDAGGRR